MLVADIEAAALVRNQPQAIKALRMPHVHREDLDVKLLGLFQSSRLVRVHGPRQQILNLCRIGRFELGACGFMSVTPQKMLSLRSDRSHKLP